MSRTYRVAILVETSSGWGRRLIRGIGNFIDRHQAWDVDITPRDTFAEQTVPEGWAGDGIIARVRTPAMAAHLGSLGVPVVNVSAIDLPEFDFPRVNTNLDATARLAADHFTERGYVHFAYAGPLQQSWVARHADAFRDAALGTVESEKISMFDTTPFQFEPTRATQPGTVALGELSDWVAGIPRSAGLFAWSIADATLLIRLCAARDIAVPDEIAILAGDEDPTLCDISRPTLSGLVAASEQIGYQAAQRLQNLMAGGDDDGQPLLVDPVEVNARGSTNAFAIKDTDLRQAMRFLRENAHRPVRIDELAAALSASRRSLERKFRAHFGRSPLEELQRLRLARVRQMLTLTDLSVSQIAEQCGFTAPEYMTTVFRQETGMTPLKYRAKVRAC